jgi:hypothetical protein
MKKKIASFFCKEKAKGWLVKEANEESMTDF